MHLGNWAFGMPQHQQMKSPTEMTVLRLITDKKESTGGFSCTLGCRQYPASNLIQWMHILWAINILLYCLLIYPVGLYNISRLHDTQSLFCDASHSGNLCERGWRSHHPCRFDSFRAWNVDLWWIRGSNTSWFKREKIQSPSFQTFWH